LKEWPKEKPTRNESKENRKEARIKLKDITNS
jgi:hypothetical protein